MEIYEECLKAYEQGGQYAVFDWVKENYPNANWAVCPPCETETPYLEQTCLVCGSENEKGKMGMYGSYEEALTMVLSVIEEMEKSESFDSATLEELKQRIV